MIPVWLANENMIVQMADGGVTNRYEYTGLVVRRDLFNVVFTDSSL